MHLRIDKIIVDHYGYCDHKGIPIKANTYQAVLVDEDDEIIVKVFGLGKQQCRDRAAEFLIKLNRRIGQ